MSYLYNRKRSEEAESGPAQANRAAVHGMTGLSFPNSAMLSALGYSGTEFGPDVPDPRAVLEANRAQRPDAESEADRLSAGIASRTPEALKVEMGARLGADLSSIRFHTGAASVRQSDRMAARAWTRGGDVYFGEGGFDPAVAAHELVHTVQQGAAEGQTAVFAPSGAVQMMPHPIRWIKERIRQARERRHNKKQGNTAPDAAETPPVPSETVMEASAPAETLPVSPASAETAAESSVTEETLPVSPASAATAAEPSVTEETPPVSPASTETAVEAPVTAQSQTDREPASSGAEHKPPAPVFEYDQKKIDARRHKNDMLEELQEYWRQEKESRHQAEVNEEAKLALSFEEEEAVRKKRPWELSEVDLARDRFNPSLSPEVRRIQAQIDEAKTPAEAYRIFSAFAGNDSGKMVTNEGEDWNPDDVDMDRFRAKMKNMVRMVNDYPELVGMIGNMSPITKKKSLMATTSTEGGAVKAQLEYNDEADRQRPEKQADKSSEKKPSSDTSPVKKLFRLPAREPETGNSADASYVGTHELGHVLNSLLFSSKTRKDRKQAGEDWLYSITSGQIVDDVLRQNMSEDEHKALWRHQETDTRKKKFMKGQVFLKANMLAERGFTSAYGEKDASEFFAEAFSDVYAHGEKAKKASIDLVKEYERRYRVKQDAERRR